VVNWYSGEIWYWFGKGLIGTVEKDGTGLVRGVNWYSGEILYWFGMRG
jgi:hypothetical protein